MGNGERIPIVALFLLEDRLGHGSRSLGLVLESSQRHRG